MANRLVLEISRVGFTSPTLDLTTQVPLKPVQRNSTFRIWFFSFILHACLRLMQFLLWFWWWQRRFLWLGRETRISSAAGTSTADMSNLWLGESLDITNLPLSLVLYCSGYFSYFFKIFLLLLLLKIFISEMHLLGLCFLTLAFGFLFLVWQSQRRKRSPVGNILFNLLFLLCSC